MSGESKVLVMPIKTRRRGGVAFEPAPEPEECLRELFEQEAQLEAGLRLVRAKQAQVRRRYADKHGLLMLPSLEQMRRIVGS